MLYNFPFSRIQEFDTHLNKMTDEAGEKFKREMDTAFAEAKERVEAEFRSR